MNLTEAPSDNAKVLRLFREQDNLGVDSSLFLRAFRQLTSDGKPLGQIMALTIPVGDERRMPIGMLTVTKDNRLVFWPVLPRRPAVILDRPGVDLPDHVTIEFPSEKIHVTRYGPGGTPNRQTDGWRSAPIEGDDFRLLFAFFVRLSVILDQDVLVSRQIPAPTSDKDRRTDEFKRAARAMVIQHFAVPECRIERHYAYLGIYATSAPLTMDSIPASIVPRIASEGMVDEWADNAEFPVALGQGLAVGDQRLCLAAAFPPGKLKEDLCFGFPTRRSRRVS